MGDGPQLISAMASSYYSQNVHSSGGEQGKNGQRN
jgi:hypothetical protein